MATPGRQEDPDVAAGIAQEYEEMARRLRLEPYSFRFFQAVWLLERMQPEALPVGEFGDPRREAVRFGSHPSLSFPASDIQELDWTGQQPRMTVNFMGLHGLAGALPFPYTELIQERLRARDRGMRQFFDHLSHRLISLFYRAWKRYRFATDARRFRQMLLSLAGLGTAGLERRQAVADDSLAFYTGLLSLQPRSAAALEQLLSDYFGVPAEVEQFVGAWYSLGPEMMSHLEAETESEQLGSGCVIGDEVWDQQSKARVKLGPLTRQQYNEFLPGSPGHKRLNDLTRFFGRDQIDFEVQLILARKDVPGCRLDDSDPVQLGWTTWVKTTPQFPRDPGDAVLELRAMP